jgi:hypothetical protein
MTVHYIESGVVNEIFGARSSRKQNSTAIHFQPWEAERGYADPISYASGFFGQ